MLARIERALDKAVSRATTADCPPRLADALRYAVFPGGQRIRPRLALTVAFACGDDDPAAADGAAAAIELLHCASLVHDDLPCFDDADTRRGKLSVHKAFSEPLAVLAGDALIVMAFDVIARSAVLKPQRLASLVSIVARSVGGPSGICAGQAWECEPSVDVALYHRAKTGSLFSGATAAGAAAAGADPDTWRALGDFIGEAYQVADDIRDVWANPDMVGKPCGRDAALGRPSAARDLGLRGAVMRLESLVADAAASIPPCPRAELLRAIILKEAEQFLPQEIRLAA